MSIVMVLQNSFLYIESVTSNSLQHCLQFTVGKVVAAR